MAKRRSRGGVSGSGGDQAIINKSSGFPRDPAVGQDVPNTGSRPDTFTYGNAGRNVFFGGTKSLQFRLEAFNLFNTPVWGDPTMAMSSPLYGQINTTRIPMRELQIGLKFAF